MAAALLALAGAGCFTRPVNHAPEITISGLPTPLRKATAIFTARATDPDGERPRVMWDAVPGPCTDDTGPESWPPSTDWKASMGDQATLMLDGKDTNAPFCLWAFAIDSHGAMNADHMAVVPQDQAPIARLTVVDPDPVMFMAGNVTYPLYSTILLSGSGSSDPDGDALVNKTWTFTHTPGNQGPTLDNCNGMDLCRFVANMPGEYDISFTVSDGTATAETQLTIIVNQDKPPCIGPSDPDFLASPMVEVTLPSPTDPTPDPLPSFTIHSVADDGAPWPPGPKGGTTFRWYVSTDGQQFQFFNNDYPTLPLASTGLFKTGDIVKVRVEVSDGNSMNDAALAGCKDDDDLCQIVPGCFQRVTWSVDFR